MTQDRILVAPQEHIEITAIDLPDEKELKRKLLAIAHFQSLVRSNLKSDVDYGIIPGTQKPTLLKPGAEKIAKLLNLADTYEVIEKTEDWKEGFFSYTVRAILSDITSSKVISTGLGNCNSMESKYRWRWVFWNQVSEAERKSPTAVTRKTSKGQLLYRQANDDIYSSVNTLLKMSKKRALVDAALSVGRLSEIFTQDMDELPRVIEGTAQEVADPSQDAPQGQETPLQGQESSNATPEPENAPEKADLCPVHKVPWIDGSYGFYHGPKGKDGYCSPKKIKAAQAKES